MDTPKLDDVRSGYYKPPKMEDNHYPEPPSMRESDYYCQGIDKFFYVPSASMEYRYCFNVAGRGTQHLGYGRCDLHGGNTNVLTPRLQARYGDIADERFVELYNKFLNDPDPFNLRPELAAARTLFQKWQEEYGDYVRVGVAWEASFNSNRRGLHDYPLYHAGAIKIALEKLQGRDIRAMGIGELNAYLDDAAEEYKERWEAADGTGKRVATLTAEKPKKVPDFNEGRLHLETINKLIVSILEQEKNAWINREAYLAILNGLAEVVRVSFKRFMARQGYTLTHKELAELFTDMGKGVEELTNSTIDARFIAESTKDYVRGEWLKQASEPMVIELPPLPPSDEA